MWSPLTADFIGIFRDLWRNIWHKYRWNPLIFAISGDMSLKTHPILKSVTTLCQRGMLSKGMWVRRDRMSIIWLYTHTHNTNSSGSCINVRDKPRPWRYVAPSRIDLSRQMLVWCQTRLQSKENKIIFIQSPVNLSQTLRRAACLYVCMNVCSQMNPLVLIILCTLPLSVPLLLTMLLQIFWMCLLSSASCGPYSVYMDECTLARTGG